MPLNNSKKEASFTVEGVGGATPVVPGIDV
jgi:hypothetical protein